MKFRKDITFDEAHQALSYDPETGVFLWKLDRSYHAKAGEEAGCTYNGYRWIVINRVRYAAHRLAWLMMTGDWPSYQIDHKDMDRGNNKFANLRQATHAQNNYNRRATAGLKGVTRAPKADYLNLTSPWTAQIQLPTGHVNLGCYRTEQEAHEAYCRAAKQYFGEFARTE